MVVKNYYLPSEEKYKLVNKIIKDKLPSDFKFIRNFSNQGKQGVVGILKIKDNDELCVYKISQYINHLARHEYYIMKSLNKLREYCPHFCKVFKLIKQTVDADYRKKENPFSINTKHPINIDTILMELLPHKKLYNFIKNKEISEDIIYSSVKQVLLAIFID